MGEGSGHPGNTGASGHPDSGARGADSASGVGAHVPCRFPEDEPGRMIRGIREGDNASVTGSTAESAHVTTGGGDALPHVTPLHVTPPRVTDSTAESAHVTTGGGDAPPCVTPPPRSTPLGHRPRRQRAESTRVPALRELTLRRGQKTAKEAASVKPERALWGTEPGGGSPERVCGAPPPAGGRQAERPAVRCLQRSTTGMRGAVCPAGSDDKRG